MATDRAETFEDDLDLKQRRKTRTTPLSTLALAWGTLGVIYGDIGTSPLYVYATVFSSIHPNKEDILGVVSLIFWTLTFVVLIKYVAVVLLADDDGEGGTFALYSFLCRNIGIKPHSMLLGNKSRMLRSLASTESRLTSGSVGSRVRSGGDADRQANPWWRRFAVKSSTVRRLMRRSLSCQMALWFLTMAATGMVLGDGVLTPAISVMSAVSGLKEASPAVETNTIVGVSVAIFVFLYGIQQFGTSKVSFMFAPIVALWLAANAGVAVYNLSRYGGEVFGGLSPHHIVMFFSRNGAEGWRMMGGVMLCVTGAEALYADLGHFSRSSIMLGFGLYAYPCLVLTYIGQGAFIMNNPQDVGATFWKCCPRSFFYPMLVLATLASVVASQALISGAFSIVSNAVKLGCFPKLPITHTSDKVRGQIYVAAVNWTLLLLCVAVVVGFQDTVALGNAYGLTVSSVFLITTVLVLLVMLAVWEVSLLAVVPFGLFYLALEAVFVSANLVKVPEGGWFSLAVTVGVCYIMSVWWNGSLRRMAALNRGLHANLADLFVVLQPNQLPQLAGGQLHSRLGPAPDSPSVVASPVTVVLGTPSTDVSASQSVAAHLQTQTHTQTQLATASQAPWRTAGGTGDSNSAGARSQSSPPQPQDQAAGPTLGLAASSSPSISREIRTASSATATPITTTSSRNQQHDIADDNNRTRDIEVKNTSALGLSSAPVGPTPSALSGFPYAGPAPASTTMSVPVSGPAASMLIMETIPTAGAIAAAAITVNTTANAAVQPPLVAAVSARLSAWRSVQLALRLPSSELWMLSRQPGIGLYYNENPMGLPHVMVHFLRNLQSMHDVSIFLTVRFLPIPHVEASRRLLVEELHPIPNFYRVCARYGYMDKVEHGPAFLSCMVDAIVKVLRRQVPTHDEVEDEEDEDDQQRADSQGGAHIGGEGRLSAVTAVRLQHRQQQAGALQQDVENVEESQRRATKPKRGDGLVAVDENAVAHVLEALRQGVVYYLGNIHVLADPSMSMPYQLLVATPYRGLLTLSHSEVQDWKLPYDKVLELGLVVRI